MLHVINRCTLHVINRCTSKVVYFNNTSFPTQENTSTTTQLSTEHHKNFPSTTLPFLSCLSLLENTFREWNFDTYIVLHQLYSKHQLCIGNLGSFRCTRLQMFFKKSVPKNLAMRTGKHLKENTQRPPTLLKRDPNTGVFLPNAKFCKNSFQ